MKQFSFLLWKRDRALGIFTKARDRLKKSIEDISRAHEESYRKRDKAKMEMDYLQIHLDQAQGTLQRINAVLGE